MATYKYQQNLFEGASYGYVKYNITPDFGTYIAAGDTVTITGQAYFKNRANKSLQVSVSTTGKYRDAYINKTFSKATATTFTITFPMWDLSKWSTERFATYPITFTFWADADLEGNGDGTMEVEGQEIGALVYKLAPAKKNVVFERYSLNSGTYRKDDEGTYVFGTLAFSINSMAKASDITVAKATVTTEDSTIATKTLSSSIITEALSETGYVETAPSLFSGITFNPSYNYTISFEIGDSYETVIFSVLVARAFANMHLSGKTTGGVCFGGFSSSSDGVPKLESHFPIYPYGGIEPTDTVYPTLRSGFSTPGDYGGTLVFRRIGNLAIISGSVKLTTAASVATICTLPEGFVPTTSHYYLAAITGSQIARISVYGSNDNASDPGCLRLEWVKKMSSTSSVSATQSWIDCSTVYWIN